MLSELDFEEIPSYKLSVRVQDSKTGASSIAILHVLVQDINDNPPVIEASPYFVKVRESSPVGTSLLRVQTSDKDSGVNQRRSFHVVSDTSIVPGTFVVTEDTGILRVQKKLDYETQKRIDVVVRVADHGDPSLSAETVITVIITFFSNKERLTNILDKTLSYTCKTKSQSSSLPMAFLEIVMDFLIGIIY